MEPFTSLPLRPLFVLMPKSDRAMKVSFMESNKHFHDDKSVGSGLAIPPFCLMSAHTTTLATLGRNGDILMTGSDISRTHCSFEVNPESLLVLLHDQSRQQSCQFIGKDAIPFQPGRLRRVVVLPGINTILSIGDSSNPAIFRLKWNYSIQDIYENRHESIFRFTRSSHVNLTALGKLALQSSKGEWTTDMPRKSDIRYRVIHRIGNGGFGVVRRAVDIDTGRWLAVKSIKGSASNGVDPKREVFVQSTLQHPNIVGFLGWEETPPVHSKNVNLIMPLMKGTLHSLKHQDGPRCKSFSNQVLREMLQALDFLSSRNIVHRDLKPANILYRNSPESGEVNFILADFGLSNHPQFARLRGGTPLYMAPEIAVDDSTQPPASNSDVWSLFVTILWMNGSLDSLRTPPSVNQQWYYELWQFLLSSAQRFDPAIKEMAVLNPVNRASAAQMLVKLFGGNNLTTDLKCIPPLREGDHFTQIMAGEIKELARLLQNGNGLFMIGT